MSDPKKHKPRLLVVGPDRYAQIDRAMRAPDVHSIIISHPDVNKTRIEINGEHWELIDEPKSKRWNGSSRMTNILAATLAMAGSLPMTDSRGGERMPTYPLEYLVREYALIQQKKSHLSRRERYWVTHQFESKFRKVTT